jgi:3-hydroxymyristoyl/3-hydroxydecanoyl-(acyl carrier protein) dehydratase
MITLALPIETDHPAYAGHFPGRPILPGVVLLDRAKSALENASGLAITGIAMAKFLSPSLPGEALALDYEATDTALRFEIRCGERRIATGRFALAAAP